MTLSTGETAPALRVCVVGLGYVGLPTAALIAARGMQVLGVDPRPEVVDAVNRGRVPVAEPHLDVLLRGASESKRLSAGAAPGEADVFVIAAQSSAPESGSAGDLDTESIFDAARRIAPFLRSGNLVLLESIAPVGTTEAVAALLADAGVDMGGIHLAYSPERVMPGRIVVELVENERVIGGRTPECARRAREFYGRFVTGEIHETTCRCAEMVKLTESAFRDVNIAFANELSMLCANLGIGVFELIRLANCHPRVKILMPGCGVGGQAVAAAPRAIAARNPEQSKLIRTARGVNDAKTAWVLDRIRAGYRSLEKSRPCVVLCGLSFKPNVSDLSASPALAIAHALATEDDATFLWVEPNVAQVAGLALTTIGEALAQADLVVKLVNHRAFDGAFDGVDVPFLNFAG